MPEISDYKWSQAEGSKIFGCNNDFDRELLAGNFVSQGNTSQVKRQCKYNCHPGNNNGFAQKLRDDFFRCAPTAFLIPISLALNADRAVDRFI